MIASTTAPSRPQIQSKQPKINFLQKIETNYLLQGVLEGFIDGILILTEEGVLIHANQVAKQICDRINQFDGKDNLLPPEIWHICQSLIESIELFPDRKMSLESEISKDEIGSFRVRVRWLKLEQIERPCLLVTLEDRYQSLQRMVNNDVYQYNLTAREAEVWLLYRDNYSYQEIADKLYITINTVKKHMKNIHAKRKSTDDEEM